MLSHFGDFELLFLTIAVLAVAAAPWCPTVPELEPLPRRRRTVRDLVKRLSRSDFLKPTAALAASTAALAVNRIQVSRREREPGSSWCATTPAPRG